MNLYYHPILGLQYCFLPKKEKLQSRKNLKPVGSKFFKQKETRRDYPKQENEHNALADARWNKKLYEFLQ